MARGFPDFFGQNIFLVHGAFTEDHFASAAVVNLIPTIMHDITGKGIIRGGHGHAYSDTADGDAIIRIHAYIDGSASILLFHFEPTTRQVYEVETKFCKLVFANYTDSYVRWQFINEIPFTLRCRITITPVFTTGAVHAGSEVYYSLYT